MVASTGLEMGNTILANTVIWVAPSILADSMMESGMVVRKKVREIVTLNEETHKGRIRAHRVLDMCSTWPTTT
ncbi:unknown [Firmicutes bacterium CAG:137]|nr:unknown [Firmicutes bacterium CAG:137]